MDKTKILVIDDDEEFTLVVKSGLEETGKYEVKTENKGALGFSAAKEFQPDLVLLDILMPDTEGGEVASQLKEDEDTETIPIVFLTAVVQEEEVERHGGVIGGHPFIAKPVSLDELIDGIEKYIE